MHTCMRSHGEEPGCGRKIAPLSGARTSAPAHSSLPQLPFGSEEGNKQAAHNQRQILSLTQLVPASAAGVHTPGMPAGLLLVDEWLRGRPRLCPRSILRAWFQSASMGRSQTGSPPRDDLLREMISYWEKTKESATLCPQEGFRGGDLGGPTHCLQGGRGVRWA